MNPKNPEPFIITRDHLNLVRLATADQSRYAMSCLYFDCDGVAATDGRKLAKMPYAPAPWTSPQDTPAPAAFEPFLLAPQEVKALLANARNGEFYMIEAYQSKNGKGSGSVCFRQYRPRKKSEPHTAGPGQLFQCAVEDGRFPEYAALAGPAMPRPLVLEKRHLLDCLNALPDQEVALYLGREGRSAALHRPIQLVGCEEDGSHSGAWAIMMPLKVAPSSSLAGPITRETARREPGKVSEPEPEPVEEPQPDPEDPEDPEDEDSKVIYFSSVRESPAEAVEEAASAAPVYGSRDVKDLEVLAGIRRAQGGRHWLPEREQWAKRKPASRPRTAVPAAKPAAREAPVLEAEDLSGKRGNHAWLDLAVARAETGWTTRGFISRKAVENALARAAAEQPEFHVEEWSVAKAEGRYRAAWTPGLRA